eukprot:m.339228 g.339228  ORF g.339228 m.339228 type:complete len:322 (+) comp18715_c0_seq1:512-1477(+)
MTSTLPIMGSEDMFLANLLNNAEIPSLSPSAPFDPTIDEFDFDLIDANIAHQVKEVLAGKPFMPDSEASQAFKNDEYTPPILPSLDGGRHRSNSLSDLWGPNTIPNLDPSQGPSRTSTSPADFPILLLDPLSSTPPQRQPRLLETKSHSPKPTQKSKYSRNSSDGSNPRRKTKAGVCACCGATSTPLWRDGKNGCRLCNACGIRWVKYGIACTKCGYVPRKTECKGTKCPKCNETLPPPETHMSNRRNKPGPLKYNPLDRVTTGLPHPGRSPLSATPQSAPPFGPLSPSPLTPASMGPNGPLTSPLPMSPLTSSVFGLQLS